jgi:hypothetical protein
MRHLPHPQRRLTTSKIRKATKFRSSSIDPVIEILDGFTPEVLADLFARGEHSPRPDGFPTSSRSSGRSSEPSSPVENAVVTLIEGRIPSDPLGDAVREFKTNQDEILRLAKRQSKLHEIVVHADDVVDYQLRAKLQSTCQACGREVSGNRDDRLRSGYCPAHYMRFKRLPADERDRVRFEALIRKELEEQVA